MRRLYVAYGSNLNVEQMGFRCPSAKIYGVGVLKNWELLFRGSKTGAYATIKRCAGSSVPVVVWVIGENDERNLDRYEGYPTFYFKQNVMVDLPFGKKKAMVYIMNTFARPGIPTQHYVDVVRKGYKDNSLDEEYLDNSLHKNMLECKKDVQYH